MSKSFRKKGEHVMKKILILATLIFILASTAAFADSGISIMINGGKIDLKGSEPYIVNSRTLVPIRFIGENLGATVDWDGQKQAALIKAADKNILVKVGQTEAVVNENTLTMEVKPELTNGRVYVPLRAIAELLNVKVDWDGNTKTVIIQSTGTKPISELPKEDVKKPVEEKKEEAKNGIPEPTIDIITYYHDEWETKHFQIAINNINNYSSDTEFRIVCTSHEELNSYEQPSWYVENKWYLYDKTEWMKQSVIADKEVPTIYTLSRSPYFVAQKYIKTFKLKDGMTFEFKVYVKKGKTIKEYPIKVENFKYIERRKQ